MSKKSTFACRSAMNLSLLPKDLLHGRFAKKSKENDRVPNLKFKSHCFFVRN